ncbi:MAG: C10 family peptidase, partial [Muribaculaceae bacterium]|nr:C10 family peptidase [Muribaculaceae bacterium]
AVTPLLSTVWNQYEPYNDMCPEINGMRAVTGCVATAMAQVMKKHQWPVSGTGSYSYVANGISVSSDFSSHVYDWDNMLDDYYNEYYDLVGTQAQRNAVAQLMFDCGVAARMTYSASESSAMTIAAGGGMTKYFNYDKSMEYVLRGWYSDEDWMRLMHSQISEGLPVIYAGDSEGGYGHAFILDGYDGEGYFHFNWGWGGGSDGYFSLSYNAAPGEDIGYVFNQEALVNIRPDKGSSYLPVMGIEGVFCTTSTEYSCAGDYMELTVENGTGGFYSYALTTMEYEIGVKNTLDGNVVSMGSYSLDPYYGFRGFGLDSRFFPVGEYDVYLVYKTADTDWTPMKCFVGLTSGRLHFVNDGTTITVSEKEEDITVANQAAYEAVIAEIEALKAEYEGTVAQLKEENPDYDFSEWEEIIGGALEMAGTGAAQALAAANEDGEAFAFAFDGEEIRLMIDAMIEDVKTSGIEIIENMVSEGKAMIYTLDGRKVASLARGEVNIIVTPTSTKKVYIRK